MESPRLLIVDDEQTILIAMADYFAAQGYHVEGCTDAGSAEVLLQAGAPFDAVIADLRLSVKGGRDGLDVLAAARRASTGTRTILLTAYGSREVEEQAASLGVDALLNKPHPLPEISRLLARLLG